MNVITKYVSRDYLRNGKLNIKGGSYQGTITSYGGGGGLTGNYLPAIQNQDGSYTVDLSKVQFTGSVVSYGEVTAYGSGESGGSTTTGNVTIYDGLDSEAVDVALSANQGRILKELIGNGGVETLEGLQDVELVNLADGQILKYDAAKGHWVNGDGTKVTWENIEGKPEGLTDEKLQQIIDFKADDYLLKSVWDSVFTIDSSGNLRVKPNLVGEKEISAYGSGTSSGGGSGVTVYDGLDSTSTDVALSANQGRILMDFIDKIDLSGSNVDLSDYYNKTQVDEKISDYESRADSLYVTSTDFGNHTGDTTKHITSTERTNWNTAYQSYHTHSNKSVLDGITTTLISNWNTAYTNNHTHSNKSVLDGITSTKVANWDGVVTNWNKAFTFDSDGDLKVKVNVIGEKEISAWGAGTSSGTGAITIVDGLTSTATNAALSANQGRILKELIESQTGSDVDLSNYYTKTQVDDLIEDVDPSWSNISGKPTFATVATSGSYSDLSNKPTIPTNTNQLTNGAGYITGITKSMVTTALGYTPPTSDTWRPLGTTSDTACAGNDSRLSNARPASDVYSWAKASSKPSYSWSEITSKPTSMPASDVYSWAKASSKPSYSWSEITSKPSFATVATSGKYSDLSGKPTIPTNNNQLTNGAGYITSSGSISGNAGSATKLANSRTLWGQSFNGTANVSGNITGSYFKINDTSSNPYLQLTQGSTWYIQGYNSYLYLGAGSTKSLRIDSSGNCLSVGEVTAHSDKRLKSDIKPLEVRGELNPVTYVKDGKESIGFIADEVKEVYPELVITDESTDEKYLSLNYAQLTAVLYAEIKELKNQIKELNEKVRTMAN